MKYKRERRGLFPSDPGGRARCLSVFGMTRACCRDGDAKTESMVTLGKRLVSPIRGKASLRKASKGKGFQQGAC